MTSINRRFVLASASPRRLEILRQAGFDPEVIPPDIVEEQHSFDNPETTALELARMKAESVAQQIPDGIIVGADTVVVLDDVILGKPSGDAAAVKMLRSLSGRTHIVITAVYVIEKPSGLSAAHAEKTLVTFNTMDDTTINEYVSESKPFDKAGAYGIQDPGAVFIRKFEGDYENIKGFPLGKFLELLESQPFRNTL